MADEFSNVADEVSAPATRLVAVVPHDSDPLSDIPKALYVGGGGAVAIVGSAGGAVVLSNVPSGSVVPVRARIVKATGTTATDIVALY